MSKAFVKDDAPIEEIKADHRVLTEGRTNYMTLSGYNAFKAEALALEVERTHRAHTALSEHTMRVQTLNARLSIVKAALDSAQVIDPARQRGDQVLFGATVTVMVENGTERIYQIVGIDEAHAAEGKVSWISPIGKTLLQARVGDTVVFQTLSKSEEIEIRKINYN